MKQQSAKQFFSTQAGKLTLAIIAMVVCWTVLIVYLSNTSTGGTWFPTEVDMNRVRQDIKKDTNTLATEQANKAAYDALEDQFQHHQSPMRRSQDIGAISCRRHARCRTTRLSCHI